jgi:hypothetical protein
MQPEMDRDQAARERDRQLRAEQVQRRRLALGVVVVGVIVLIVVLALALSGGGDNASSTSTESTSPDLTLTDAAFSAELTGADSVPPVKTTAAATLNLTYDAETQTFTYVLEVTHNLSNPSVAAIKQGSPGTSGATVYTLFAGPTQEGVFSGVLADGTILEEDLVGPLLGMTIADLIALIKDGGAYVSIGNTSHPVDAIRGQIE